jgi:hypothetical protein
MIIVIYLRFPPGYCCAQQLPGLRTVEKAYFKGTRTKNGAPGGRYWQNTANYDIKVSFTPASRQLTGVVNIDYTNNSTDTLKALVLKLYPNLYKNDAIRNMYVFPDDLGSGIHISSISMDDHKLDSTRTTIFGTNMHINGTHILPGQQAHLSVTYDYVLNKSSFIRTGQIDTGAFFITYFFPRVTVYDDIDGWNELPYAGKEEFYNDYGNFHAEITVPGSYQVWATGNLENEKEVYTPQIVNRINEAENRDAITDIITNNDLKHGGITANNITNTWKFKADNVTDFAFAISNHYIWKASSVLVDSVSKRRTRVDAVFNPLHADYQPVIEYARKTVDLISNYFPKVPFPYPHETIFDGLDAMEYPMMVNNLPFKSKQETVELTAHEIFHTLFPFYVGTNETKYSFMDEGWATMTEFYFYPKIDLTNSINYDISDLNNSAGTAEDVPVMTPTPQLYGKARFSDKDLKPALAMYYLKEMLGNKLFIKAVQYYIKNWHGKHPTPYDFFNCMNTGSGRNLNWFWINWFFEKNVPDLSIKKVTRNKSNYQIEIASVGELAVPIHMTITYQDGSTQKVNRDISCWEKHNKSVVFYISNKKNIKQLTIGSELDADVNQGNNIWNVH